MSGTEVARAAAGGWSWPMAVRVGLASALLLLGAPALADDFGPPPVVPPLIVVPGYAPTACYPEVRIFETLKYGPTDICRLRMKYRPGRLECYQIVDQVCGSFLANGQWFEGRNIVSTNVVPCPDGPPQPMCPQLGADGILNRRSLRYR
jgi:hypothetical protein